MLNAAEPAPEGASGAERPGDERLEDFDAAVAQIAAWVLPAYSAADGWLERTRAGLLALLGFCEEQSRVARQVLLDSIAGGDAVLERRSQLLDVLARELDRGCEETDPVHVPEPQTAENLLGACLSLLQTRLEREQGRALCELGPSLMSMIVQPYRGAEAARGELGQAHTPLGEGLLQRKPTGQLSQPPGRNY